MEALTNAAVSSLRLKIIPTTAKKLQPKAQTLRCFRKNDNGASFSAECLHAELEVQNTCSAQEPVVSTGGGSNMNHIEIWKLFNDAQKNILQLNKQRVMALEELNKIQREKELLLNKIEQLEARNQKHVIQDSGPHLDSQSILCELLLRVDSMVLSGLIGKGEASDLRRMIMDNKSSLADSFVITEQKRDTELLADLRQLSGRSKGIGLHIVHICTEMEPVASVGAVASFVTGLSRALQRKGNLVEVILPRYKSLDIDKVQGFRKVDVEFHSFFGGHWHGNRIWTGVLHGIGVTFIEPLYHSSFFNRDKIYGYSDDFERDILVSSCSVVHSIVYGSRIYTCLASDHPKHNGMIATILLSKV